MTFYPATIQKLGKLCQDAVVFILISENGLLHHLDPGQKRSARHAFPQLVVPQSMKCKILSNVHNYVAGAHFGVHKTFHKICVSRALIVP